MSVASNSHNPRAAPGGFVGEAASKKEKFVLGTLDKFNELQ